MDTETPPDFSHVAAIGKGALRKILQAASDQSGLNFGRLTVLDPKYDPFRKDTPAGHRDGRWFAEQFHRFVALRGNRRIHNRGLHYAIVMAPEPVLKPDGKVYRNDLDCWQWLQDTASPAARYLGYVPFSVIVDERSDEAEIHVPIVPDAYAHPTTGRRETIMSADWYQPGWAVGGFEAPQPFRILLWAEKSSAGGILRPIAQQYGAECLIGTGSVSITRLREAAERQVQDGRPLVVLVLADFDPSGHGMAREIARKLQAFHHSDLPTLEARVWRVGLTAAQCRDLDLPESVLKEELKDRKANWIAAWGREQTELDAAIIGQPDALRRIITEWVRLFHDPTLARRARQAKQDYVNALYREHPVGSMREFQQAYKRFWRASEDLHRVQKSIARRLRKADLAPIERPEPRLEYEPAEPPLFSTADPYLDATLKLIADKEYRQGASPPSPNPSV